MLQEIPIKIQWKILKKNILVESKSDDWSLISKIFSIAQCPDLKYCLSLRQHKNCQDYKSKIHLALLVDFETIGFKFTQVKANYNVKIPSAKFSFETEFIFKRGQLSGKLFCTPEELLDPSNNFFVDNIMDVILEGNLSIERDNSYYDAEEFIQIKNNHLGLRLWDREDKDFTIVVGGKEIKIHKLIISAESSVFDRMIQSGLKESKENKVTISDFDSEIVEIAMKFCYGVNISKLIVVENAVDTSMEIFLLSHMVPLNVCTIANASILSNSPTLSKKCSDYIVESKKKRITISNLSFLDKDFKTKLYAFSPYN
uniref:BTB domain-containing protein n=1 Tax=Panagrolaimus davidi TaxID=227884 RepID=A0A914PCY3_9BILA